MTRKRKDYRELKVSSFSGYGYKSAPMLRIQGLWLEELGFNIGDPILVKCEDGKLIITVDHAREDAETKEQAFLDEEMKKLQKKFEVEKKKIYQQVVAERKVRYALKVSHLSGACSGRFLVLPPLTLVALHGEQKYLMRSLPSFIF